MKKNWIKINQTTKKKRSIPTSKTIDGINVIRPFPFNTRICESHKKLKFEHNKNLFETLLRLYLPIYINLLLMWKDKQKINYQEKWCNDAINNIKRWCKRRRYHQIILGINSNSTTTTTCNADLIWWRPCE